MPRKLTTSAALILTMLCGAPAANAQDPVKPEEMRHCVYTNATGWRCVVLFPDNG